MSLTAAANNALSGLKVTGQGVNLASQNIARAGDPAYNRKTLSQADVYRDGVTGGARAKDVRRELDYGLQRLVRDLEGSVKASEANARYTERLTSIFGDPNSDTSFSKVFDTFQAKLNELSARPESQTLRAEVLGAAEAVATQLNSSAETLLSSRQSIENDLATQVDTLNGALEQLHDVNEGLYRASHGSAAHANLLDQRDQLLQNISGKLEISVNELSSGAVHLSSKSGQILISDEPSELRFVRHAVDHSEAIYNADPNKSGVGHITVNSQGRSVNITSSNLLGNGSLGTLVNLRDEVYPEALSQLDDIAHSLTTALNRETKDGTAVTAGASEGFDLDTSDLASGNRLELTYTDGGTTKTLSVIRVDSAASLPIEETSLSGDNLVIGADFSGGLAGVVASLNTALGGKLVFSDQGSDVLRVLDDGAAGTSDISAASAHSTATGFDGEGLGIPLFVDASERPYTDNREGLTQRLGFASRISINEEVTKDSSKLIKYDLSAGSATLDGDGTRPAELFNRLNEIKVETSPRSGIEFSSGRETTSLSGIISRVISAQSQAAEKAERQQSVQKASYDTFSSQYDSSRAVDLDEEFSLLLTLQNAYAANAKVLTVVNDLNRVLLNI